MMITNKKNIGLYIHIPFCERKCDYCGFLSFPMKETERSTCIDFLLKELKQRGNKPYIQDKTVDTVFIGGGTPSLLSGSQMDQLLTTIKESYNLAEDTEITCEANPNSLTYDKLKDFKSSGINRLSIGIQSFNDEVLKALGRLHNSEQGITAFKEARRAGFNNINIDIMFALPNQDMSLWKDTLNQAVSLEPEHISFYGLQIEENTPFYERYKNDNLNCVDDKEADRMYLSACEVLKTNGFEHYEISNAAKPGYRCRHNLKYWDMSYFAAVGPGASGYIDGFRYENPSVIKTWKDKIKDGHIADLNIKDKENIKDTMSVFCFTSLRTSDGIDTKEFEKKFGLSIFKAFPNIENIIYNYVNNGLINISSDGHITLTEEGFLKSNDFMCEFV